MSTTESNAPTEEKASAEAPKPKPKPKAKAKPPAPTPKVKKWEIRNLLYQKIILNLTPVLDGVAQPQVGIEIEGRGVRLVKWADSLGPDVESKKTKRMLSVVAIEV